MAINTAPQATPSRSAVQPKPKASLRVTLLGMLEAACYVTLIALVGFGIQQMHANHAELLLLGVQPSKIEKQDAFKQYVQLVLAAILALYRLGSKIYQDIENRKKQQMNPTNSQQSVQQLAQQPTQDPTRQPAGESAHQQLTSGDLSDVDVNVTIHYVAPARSSISH